MDLPWHLLKKKMKKKKKKKKKESESPYLERYSVFYMVLSLEFFF